MPNQPKTPAAAFRIPEDLRALLKARAEKEETTETAVVIAALESYLNGG